MRATANQEAERYLQPGSSKSRTQQIVEVCRLVADLWCDGEFERAKYIRYQLVTKFPTRHDSINLTITNFIHHKAEEAKRNGTRLPPRRTSELLHDVRSPQLQRVRRM